MRNLMEIISPKKKKTGIIRVEQIGNSEINRGKKYEMIYEIVELKNVNGLSKIKIVETSIMDEEIPEWVDESKIEWFTH